MELYARRRLTNWLVMGLSVAATAFGLLWLVLVLGTLLINGVGAITPSLFTQMTPPPQAGVRPLEDGMDRGLALTLQAIQRQLAAMPHDLYLVRLIHQASHRPFPGQRLWTPAQLMNAAAVRFLRVRNREGYDVYFHPYAQAHNAGYILIDLDRAHPALLESMRTQGHDPCVLLQTSPGHLQAWVQVSRSRLPPAVATTIAQQLARC